MDFIMCILVDEYVSKEKIKIMSDSLTEKFKGKIHYNLIEIIYY